MRTTTTFGHSGHCNEWDECESSSFFGENTFQRPNTSGVSSPPRNFFSRLLVRRLLVGVTSSTPAHTRGGGFGWWCNSNTQYIIHKHKHVPTLKSCYTIHICIHDTYNYKYKYMSTCTACIYVQCSIVHPFPRYILVTGVSQIPNAMQQRRTILKATLGGEATLCCCVADRLKQTLRYLAH